MEDIILFTLKNQYSYYQSFDCMPFTEYGIFVRPVENPDLGKYEVLVDTDNLKSFLTNVHSERIFDDGWANSYYNIRKATKKERKYFKEQVKKFKLYSKAEKLIETPQVEKSN